MPRHAIQTNSAPANPRYSQAIVAGDFVFVAGTPGVDVATGEWLPEIEAQAENAVKSLGAILEAAGCGYDDVVKLTVYITDPSHGGKIAGTLARVFTTPPPARAMPVVKGFPIPEALISIEAIAFRAPKRGG
ncbi:MAG: RidA family protein [Thermoplasmata archaeon]